MKNKRLESVKETLRHPYTWPGHYPKTFFTHDGCLCHPCARVNFRVVCADTKLNAGPWNLTVDVLWEGEEQCVECGTEIESAYGPVTHGYEL